MISKASDFFLAFVGGVLLSLMLYLSSILASDTSAIYSSWVAHGLGAIVAICITAIVSLLMSKKAKTKETKKFPLWLYLGGIPGAFTVLLAAININGSQSVSGTIAFALFGQIVFGVASDQYGILGIPRRKIRPVDFAVVGCVLLGSLLIIYGRAGL